MEETLVSGVPAQPRLAVDAAYALLGAGGTRIVVGLVLEGAYHALASPLTPIVSLLNYRRQKCQSYAFGLY